MSFAAMILTGVLIDFLLGWPALLFARIGHPVTWLARLITLCDARLNRGTHRQRILRGATTVAVCIVACAAPAAALAASLPDGIAGILIGGALAWPLIAARALHDHVAAVARPLSSGDLNAARRAVSKIAGRDAAQLDDAGVARAGLESLAENTSDGVLAPVFWGVVAGLPGLVAYKAINTMDSMIGHRSEPYEAFGKVAARLDDIANWIPARLTGLVLAAVSGTCLADGIRVMRRDAPAHRSVNAGWPEGAMAGALGVRLSGPRAYENHVVNEPWINPEARDPNAEDLQRGLGLFRRAMAVLVLALVAAGLV